MGRRALPLSRPRRRCGSRWRQRRRRRSNEARCGGKWGWAWARGSAPRAGVASEELNAVDRNGDCVASPRIRRNSSVVPRRLAVIFASFLAAAVGLVGLLYAFGLIFRPDVATRPPDPPAHELAVVEQARANARQLDL